MLIFPSDAVGLLERMRALQGGVLPLNTRLRYGDYEFSGEMVDGRLVVCVSQFPLRVDSQTETYPVEELLEKLRIVVDDENGLNIWVRRLAKTRNWEMLLAAVALPGGFALLCFGGEYLLRAGILTLLGDIACGLGFWLHSLWMKYYQLVGQPHSISPKAEKAEKEGVSHATTVVLTAIAVASEVIMSLVHIAIAYYLGVKTMALWPRVGMLVFGLNMLLGLVVKSPLLLRYRTVNTMAIYFPGIVVTALGYATIVIVGLLSGREMSDLWMFAVGYAIFGLLSGIVGIILILQLLKGTCNTCNTGRK